MRGLSETRIFLLVIAAVLAGMFVPYWLTGQVFGTFDLAHITIPIEQLMARYQARADVPAWVSEFNAGFPLMANGFQSFYYLPHMLLRPILPAAWLTNVSLLSHMWLAAGGMWLLLRSQKLPKGAAAIGALLFSAGGYFVGRITLPHLFFPAAWIPLVLWGVFWLWEKPSAWRGVGLAALAAGLIFSGHIQMAIYAGLMVVMALVVLALSSGKAVMDWRRWLIVVGAGLLVFLLTAVQVWPVWEHLSVSRRGESLSEVEAYDVSYPLWQLPSVIYPGVFGRGDDYKGAKNEPELMAYVGVVGGLLGVLGLVSSKFWRSRLGRTAAVFMVAGVVLAGGGYSLIYRSLHELPTPLSGLANPGRALVIVYVGWVIAAAFGAVWLTRRGRWVAFAVMAAELMIWFYPQPYLMPAAAFTKDLLMREALPAAGRQAPRVYSHETIEPVSLGDFGITPGLL